jgi:phosphoribosylformylglycinamidine synthase
MSKPSVGILVFPGSNCDHDAYYAFKSVLGLQTRFIWHKESDLGGVDLILVPGGFSYGDYLRCGAIARFSPVMQEVIKFAEKGGPIVGICNGFQILLEAGLLPGAMLHNKDLRFICKNVHIRLETTNSPFTSSLQKGAVFQIPISHGEGNYTIDPAGLEELKEHDQIVFRYCTEEGEITEAANVNGSVDSIAGICNRGRNVMAMMPHPERAAEEILGNADGKQILEAIAEQL